MPTISHTQILGQKTLYLPLPPPSSPLPLLPSLNQSGVLFYFPFCTLFVTDTASNSVIWKPVESPVPRLGVVGRAESMQSEGSEDSPNSTPSVSPHSLTANTRVSPPPPPHSQYPGKPPPPHSQYPGKPPHPLTANTRVSLPPPPHSQYPGKPVHPLTANTRVSLSVSPHPLTASTRVSLSTPSQPIPG